MNAPLTHRRSPLAATYNAAADHMDASPLEFWRRHARRAAAFADLGPGDRVLDAGCGTGAAALAAAELVGPRGDVLGVDLAEAMILRARLRAADRELGNLRFRVSEMAAMAAMAERFDAVIAAFCLDPAAGGGRSLETLWQVLRPGGRLVVTAWAEAAFEPAATHFAAELDRFGVRLDAAAHRRETVVARETLAAMVELSTGCAPMIVTEADSERLVSPADWWTIAMGSGLRGAIEQLDRMERRALRERIMDRLWSHGVRQIDVSAHHAFLVKPG